MEYLKKTVTAGLFAAATLATSHALATETYYTDQGHTEVKFAWSHAGVSVQTGEFTTANGKLILDPDNVENSSIEVTIAADSISTGFAPLDKHLKSPDFFEVAKYPDITFKSTSVTKTGDKTADVAGDLTMHGVTLPVTLKTTLTHRGAHPVGNVLDYYKGDWVAFKATTEIDHMAFKIGPFPTGPISIEIVTEMKDREN